MFSAGLLAGGMHFISKVPPEGIVIGDERYNPRQLRTGLGFVAVPLFFYSSTLSTIFYIIGEYLQQLHTLLKSCLGIKRVDSPCCLPVPIRI